MDFKDHFSDRAQLYSQFRPTYPDALFEWISGLVARHELAWDCATGNGQAAVGLAGHFERVIATDASEKQISMASPHASVDYRIANASASGLETESVDVVTVAQAIHWLDHAQFYNEARRVMRRDAAIVVWGYGDPVIDDPKIDAVVHAYNRGTIEQYWKPERDLILAGLRTIPFPFREVQAPEFVMEREWTLAELSGYMRTWSATAAYITAHGVDPVAAVEESLSRSWGEGTHSIQWPLYVRAGYV